MCGICGIYNSTEPTLPPEAAEAARLMSEALRHRGPDGEGFWAGDGVILAHRRLAIIDLSNAAAQPMRNHATGASLVFNGELYNYKVLRAGLEKRGQAFRTNSDTEVLLRHLELCSPDLALSELRGMFAFAYYDARQRSLWLVRDRTGQKPLFYARHRGLLLFSSELPSLVCGLRRLGASLAVDPTAVADYLARGLVPWGRTIYRGVKRLPPAHWLRLDSKGEAMASYWSPLGQPRFAGSLDDAAAEFRQRFGESIRLNLVSDVPVGVLLSGGVDSSSVAQAAVGASSARVSTYSLGQEGGDADLEFPFSRLMARKLGTDHHEVIFSVGQPGDLPAATAAMGEPLGSPTIPMMLHLFKAIHDSGLKVILSGDGADEVFGGYEGYRWIRALAAMRSLPGLPALAGLFAQGKGRLAAPASLSQWRRGTQRSLACQLFAASPSQYLKTYQAASRRQAAALMRPELLGQLQLEADGSLPSLDTESLFDAHLYWDLAYNDRNVVRESDFAGMAHAVELRAPYLDHKLVEFGFSLPVHYRVGNYFDEQYGNKLVAKNAFKGLLPDSILYRRKMGFSEGARIAQGLAKEWKQLWVESLKANNRGGFLHPDAIALAEKAIAQGCGADSLMLWRIFALGLFLKGL